MNPRFDWKSFFWRNTYSNYFAVVARIVSGALIFRATFHYFTPEQFGFYALLWSCFGYSILLDFGLGFSTQRAAAHFTQTVICNA